MILYNLGIIQQMVKINTEIDEWLINILNSKSKSVNRKQIVTLSISLL